MSEIFPPRAIKSRQVHPLLEDLAVLPVFFDLAGKRVILQGNSEALSWKLELLRATGAQIDLFSDAPCPALMGVAENCEGLRLFARNPAPDDFAGAALAIGQAKTPEQSAAFAALARSNGVPVNMIDRPQQSDFQFGAVINRSPLVIGISTHGASPVLAQALRGRLEAFFADGLAAWVSAAKIWRARLNDLSTQARQKFWQAFAAKALETRDPPSEAWFAEFLAHANLAAKPTAQSKGSVALVGAGPGDPELLTLKALRVLQSAEVLLYDDLVSPKIVEMARREAVKIPVGKRGYKPSCKQDQIISLLLLHAAAGKRVVRLKGGDPMIFGRANEEIFALQQAGIAVEVVPGVTAALGAAASLKLSLTERDKARRLQFITAHGRDGKLPEDIDWRSVCDSRASTVVYMGVKTLRPLAKKLLAQGMDKATPALLVERATWADERSIYGTIESLPDKVLALNPEGPCLVLIGAAFAIEDIGQTGCSERADQPRS
jgi:uroporphyrin-III C-methyltransferase/precorrin-2 dehydrogenase/sirohydrochlorin ferrochelatase